MTDPARSHGSKSIRASAAPRDLMAPAPRPGAWAASVVTLFPEAFPGVLGHSLTGTALKDGLWSLDVTDLRRFGEGRHRKVDDRPAGGGAGLVLRPDIVGAALEAARGPGPMIYLSPRGRPFDQARARHLAAGPGVTLLCGRFEGVDQRVLDEYEMEEVSLGDFVLTGGEIAAQALLDATIRLLPGVIGNQASTEEESFSDGLLEHPHFTKPADWQGRTIPAVLTSGDHAKVAAWRRDQSEALTRTRRPGLWARYLDTKR
ncbi:tRNA (guanosine(37)-N1)-methyltransferase TrmD [uncultured Jannaschia sp.]|uniref:tRNA (guanosine(37)-N1)-methyltransferase TrmD n=1 Tax=uncultured Jannaschia sp. TaxID=293347 RepID=UPI00261C0CC1|nr:tRNA (guanosine(37)-N1)-methyltransferase TrmD [uncultured Jannaschia sp.]